MSKQASILINDDEIRARKAQKYKLRMDGFKIYPAKMGRNDFQIAKKVFPVVNNNKHLSSIVG